MLTKEWIIGFTEGEGCFCLGGNSAYFSISQADEDILLEIKDFFGFGYVHEIRGHKKRCFSFYVHKTSDLVKIVKFFDGLLLIKHRKEQFKIWKDVILERASTITPRDRWTKEEYTLLRVGIAPPNRTSGEIATKKFRLRKLEAM